MTIVTLGKEEIRTITLLATQRWLEKIDSTDRPNYATGKASGALEHELLATIRANAVEWAVAKHYDLPWNVPVYPNDLHPRRKDLPDVGTNLEIRSLRTRNEVPVWKKDVNKNAIIVAGRVLDTDYFTRVEILGYIKAVDAQNEAWWQTEHGCWRVPLTALSQNPRNDHNSTE